MVGLCDVLRGGRRRSLEPIDQPRDGLRQARLRETDSSAGGFPTPHRAAIDLEFLSAHDRCSCITRRVIAVGIATSTLARS
jgi:hypothetical protein